MDLWPPFTCDSLSHPGFVIVGTLTGGPAQDKKARQENLQSKKAKKAEPNDEAEDESEEEEE